MDKHPPSDEQGLEQVLRRLRELEIRISRLENKSLIQPLPGKNLLTDQPKLESTSEDSDNEGIESKVGEYGMAWLGNIVLLFGILFLIQFFKNQGYILFSSIFGFASVAGVYISGYYLRHAFPYMSKLFSYTGHLLLYSVTLKMHFITPDPLISNKIIGLFFLLIVLISITYISYHNKNQVLTGIVLIMTFITAIISNSPFFMLSLMILVSATAVYFVHKFGWWKILIASIFIVYLTFMIWAVSNPFISHTFKIIDDLQFSYIYLLACAFIYSMLAVLPVGENIRENPLNASIIFNGLGFSSIMAILLTVFFKNTYYIPLSIVAAFSIAYSALLQSRGNWRISAALYALYGFAMLSITIAGIYKFPLAFFLLSIQSLLVLSMALWFKSRFIVLMNVFMFLGLLIAYSVFPKPLSSIDFAFTAVSFITARVLNWQKDRLEIKTEILRNTYLIIGFIMTLISLYRAVPDNYVTLSWTLAAGIFFVLSILLKNVKYRWLAISALIITAFYFFLFELRQIGIGYRIIALLFLALISLSFSTFYTKRLKRSSQKTEHNSIE